MGKNKGPDKVTHEKSGVVPLTYKGTILQDNEEYIGYGSSREEAEKNAFKL